MRNHLLHAGWYLAISAGLLSVASADSSPPSPSAQRMTPVVRIVQRALESTVDIHTERRTTSTDTIFSVGRGGNKVNGMGTGIIVDERGYILTNHHVIKDVESIRVTRHCDGNYESYIATVFDFDAKSDLALLKIYPKSPLPVIPIGTSSDLMLGESVIAIGNAFGYEGSVSQGIVSALHRDVEASDDQAYENLIQTDAAINPGNSGGPLINMDGEVIGINVAIRANATKIGFAIPIDAARLAASRLFSVERNGRLYHGAVVRDHKAGSLRELLVQSVKPNSPAAQAGLKSGDVVLRVGSSSVMDGADFERALIDRKPDEPFSVVVNRDGAEQSINLQLAGVQADPGAPARQTVAANMPVAPPSGGVKSDRVWETLGLRMSPLAGGDQRLEGLSYHGGMIVTDVRRDGPAVQSGVKRGDILVGLYSFETVKENDVIYVLNHNDVRTTRLKFYIVREHETLFGFFDSNTVTK